MIKQLLTQQVKDMEAQGRKIVRYKLRVNLHFG